MTDPELRWSTEPPTVPGLYRVKRRDTYGQGQPCDVVVDQDVTGQLRADAVTFCCAVSCLNEYEWSQRFVPEDVGHAARLDDVLEFLNSKPLDPEVISALKRLTDAIDNYHQHGPTIGNMLRELQQLYEPHLQYTSPHQKQQPEGPLPDLQQSLEEFADEVFGPTKGSSRPTPKD